MNTKTLNSTNVVNITIDGQAVAVLKGTTVYAASKQLGIEIPIFCYHDRMPPFGACRMCLVEVEKMPKLQTSCTLEATEGMVIKTQSQISKEGRKEILEFLLINHPLDCPICDKGGECPLQDNTLKYGPGISRFFEEKRRFPKALHLGPVLTLDRERCIICARCTRFGEIVAGDHALQFVERGYKTEVGTPHDAAPNSKFIGNTIAICPVGALTSEVYRFRARPWDNLSTPSTCTLCPVGCNLVLDSRDGEIMRTRSCEKSSPVNDIWLCDKGWFGYEFTSHRERLQHPLIRRSGKLEKATWDEALSLIIEKFNQAKPERKLAGLGGNPLTVEENYLFQKIFREGAGVNHVDHQIGIPACEATGMEIPINECEELSYAFLLGLDLTEEFPVIWLRLKQAINRGAQVIFIGHFSPEIAPHLAKTILHAPGQELETFKQHLPEIAALAKQGKKGAIFVGSQYLWTADRNDLLSELIQLQEQNPTLSLNLMEGRGNSHGARFAGMRPDLGPLGKELSNPGLNAIQILEKASQSYWSFLYVAGADLATKVPSKLWMEARSKLSFLVVQDLFLTETAQQADVVLPTLSLVEKEGHFINIEGRIQKLHPGKEIPSTVYSDREIFTLLAERLNLSLAIDPLFLEALGQTHIPLTKHKKITSSAQKLNTIPNGLFASFAPTLFDHGVRMKHNPHLVQLAKKPHVRIHPSEAEKRGIQEGKTIHLTANGNTISATVQLDKGVSLQTIVIPLGFEELPVYELTPTLINGLSIAINKET